MVSLRGMNKSGYQTMNDDDEESGPPSITGVEESKDNDDDESGPPSMTSVEESKDNDDEGSGLPSMTSVDESKDNDDEESGLPSMTSLDESKGNDDEESGLPSTTSLDESKDNDDGDSIVEEEEDDDDDDDEEVIVEEYEDYTSDDGVLEEVSDAATPVDVETPKEIAQKAPSPPQEELPEQAPRMVRAPSIVQLDTKAVQEAKEDQCLSSLQGLVVIGILLFLAVAGIAIGTGLGVAKPFEEKNIPPTPTVSPSFTPAPSVFPTFAPVPLTLEDEELLSLWETVVGDVVYEEDTPYYEAAQWMLYRDPSRVTRRGYRRHLQSNNNTTTTTNTIEYTDEDLNYIQRYLLVFLYFATTNNGRRQWTSCNPVVPEYTEEDCVYSKAIRKLPSGEIQYEPIPWTRWLSGADECDWAGVTCTTNAQNRLVVSGIDLGTSPPKIERFHL